MRLNFSTRIPLALFCFGITLQASATNVCCQAISLAQSGVWTSTSPGAWDDPGNWANGDIANGINSTASFGATITGFTTVELSSDRTIGNLLFSEIPADGPAWEVIGRSLTLSRTIGVPFVETGTRTTIRANINGAKGLEKRGIETLSLTGKNNYSGGTFVVGGTLEVNSLGSIGTGFLSLGNSTFRYLGNATETNLRELRLNSGAATMQISDVDAHIAFNSPSGVRNSDLVKTGEGTLEIGGAITGGAQISIDQGRLILTAANTHTGANRIRSGILEIRSVSNLGSGELEISNGGILDYRGIGTETLTQPLNLTFGSATIHVHQASALLAISPSGVPHRNFRKTGAGTLRFDGELFGTGGIRVDGGQLVLTAANSYEGDTVVSSGKLIVNNTVGSGTGIGTVAVESGGAIGGNGRVTGALMSEGIVAPGNSIGTLDVGATTFFDGSSYEVELNTLSLDSDLLNVNGDLTILTGAQLVFTELMDGVVDLGAKLSLISYSGAWNGIPFKGLPQFSTFQVGNNSWQINYVDLIGGSNGGLYGNFVTIIAVPEPTSFIMAGLILLLPTLRRSRNIRRLE
jgi:autotransporter-associated beta strand protein